MKKVHSILALVMVGAIALLSCNNGPSEEEKQKRMQDSLDSVTKAQEAAAPKVNQDSIDKANADKAAHIADSLKQDSIKNAGKGKKTTATPAKTPAKAPVKPAPVKPANSTNTNPTPAPAPAPAPAPKNEPVKKGTSTDAQGGGAVKKGTTPTDAKTTGGAVKK